MILLKASPNGPRWSSKTTWLSDTVLMLVEKNATEQEIVAAIQIHRFLENIMGFCDPDIADSMLQRWEVDQVLEQ